VNWNWCRLDRRLNMLSMSTHQITIHQIANPPDHQSTNSPIARLSLRLAVRGLNRALDPGGAPIQSTPRDPDAGSECSTEHEDGDDGEERRRNLHEQEFRRLHVVFPLGSACAGRGRHTRPAGQSAISIVNQQSGQSASTNHQSAIGLLPGQPDVVHGFTSPVGPSN
jgi:hypothetical protein